jgi:multiple sugar transport system substrate-binding protein
VLKDKAGMGALTSRGQAGHQCVHAWLLHLNPLGGKVFDDQWKPRFNDTQGVQALKMLKLISDTGPVGIPGYGQGEMITSFLQGQAAMYLDSSLIFGQVIDPAKSKIGGQVSYVVHPKGVRYSSQSGGLGLAIPKNAKNADAAFLLLQWLTSKPQDKAVAKVGGVPTRNSTLNDVDMVRQYPEYITLRQQLEYSDPDWRPIIPEWDEINIQALGVAVSEALTGKKTPEDALNGMVPKVTGIMVRGGYLKA